MTLYIGRTALPGLEPWSEADAKVTTSGWLDGATPSHADRVARQLPGLKDLDLCPVWWDEYPSVDGYYGVRSASIRPELPSRQIWDWSVDMDLFAHAGACRLKSEMSGGLRPEAFDMYSIATALTFQWVALPEVAAAVDVGDITVESTWVRRGADGGVRIIRSGANELYSSQVPVSYVLHPRDFWSMAAGVRAAGVALTGMHAPLRLDDWLLSDGIVRVGPDLVSHLPVMSGPSDDEDPVWADPFPLTFGYWTGSDFVPLGTPRAVKALRTGPTRASVNLTYEVAADGQIVEVQLVQRRGDQGVIVVFGTEGTPRRWAIDPDVATFNVNWQDPEPDIIVGRRTDAINSDGNAIVIIPTVAWTAVTTGDHNGTVYQSTASSRGLMYVGWMSTISTPHPDSAINQAKMFFQGGTETLRVSR